MAKDFQVVAFWRIIQCNSLKDQEDQDDDDEDVVIEADDDGDETSYRQERSDSEVIRSAGLVRSYSSISLSNFNLLSSGSSSKMQNYLPKLFAKLFAKLFSIMGTIKCNTNHGTLKMAIWDQFLSSFYPDLKVSIAIKIIPL